MELEKIKFDRLFVPLSSNPYDWFESGKKEWELRRYGRQYNELHVRVGRLVELSKGYSSKNRLWGLITDIIQGKNLEEIFAQVHYTKILPEAISKENAIEIATTILRISPEKNQDLIAFKINFDIPKIIDFRSSLINSRMKMNVKSSSKFLEISQEVGMASKPVELEINLEYKPRFKLKTDAYSAPMGPNAKLKNAEITSNTKVSRKVERVVDMV